MDRSPVLRFALALTLLAGAGMAQGLAARQRATLAFGGAAPATGWKLYPLEPSVALDANYRFMFQRFIGVEAGLVGAWPTVYSFSRFGASPDRTSFVMLPFDLVGVAPLARGRCELFAGFGGGRVWEPGLGESFNPRSAMLLHATGGLSLALDARQRFRLDLRTRLLQDPGRPTQQWVITTGGLSYSFGRPSR
jgi:hypothetical protein